MICPCMVFKGGEVRNWYSSAIFFNECIQNSVFPTALKHAYYTPIHQKGSTTQVCNYRPISVTPIFAKLFEKLLLFQMMDHINKNNLLNKEQFGFQNKKSSTDAVLFVTETAVENHESGQNTAAIFLDLAKAFNPISHKIFLKKAKSFNFSEPAVNLLRFFSQRKITMRQNRHRGLRTHFR